MNIVYLTRARKHFFRSYIPRKTSVYNAREWCRAIRVVGDKWVLLQQERTS